MDHNSSFADRSQSQSLSHPHPALSNTELGAGATFLVLVEILAGATFVKHQ